MLNVLIVDDNPDDQELMQRLLAKMPETVDRVLVAMDEASCQAQLEDDPGIDCILLDYSLPGRDGLKVLQEIVQRDPMATVVMVTGQSDETIAVQALQTGAQDYLVKDTLTVASLTRAISNATERTRLQRKIKDQQESLQTFAHVIVHDLRTPLRGIRGAIDMLVEDLAGTLTGDNAETLDFVVQGVERADALILALQSYTEVDSALPAFDAVDLNTKVEHVRSNLAVIINQRGAKVTCDATLSTVLGSAPLIEQLLQNLVGNGIKYNRSDVPEIRISCEETTDKWVIKVTDNGIGIEPNYLQHIFEPFKRLHGQSEFEGTGLGLATCKKIAERHNGTLTCVSELGVGSTFTFLLPKANFHKANAA